MTALAFLLVLWHRYCYVLYCISLPLLVLPGSGSGSIVVSNNAKVSDRTSNNNTNRIIFIIIDHMIISKIALAYDYDNVMIMPLTMIITFTFAITIVTVVCSSSYKPKDCSKHRLNRKVKSVSSASPADGWSDRPFAQNMN